MEIQILQLKIKAQKQKIEYENSILHILKQELTEKEWKNLPQFYVPKVYDKPIINTALPQKPIGGSISGRNKIKNLVENKKVLFRQGTKPLPEEWNDIPS